MDLNFVITFLNKNILLGPFLCNFVRPKTSNKNFFEQWQSSTMSTVHELHPFLVNDIPEVKRQKVFSSKFNTIFFQGFFKNLIIIVLQF